jgi:hypothetical protein
MKLYMFRTCFGKFLCPSAGFIYCKHSNGVSHTGLLIACEQDQDGTKFYTDPAGKLSVNLYDVYHCCVYSDELLMMERGTFRSI